MGLYESPDIDAFDQVNREKDATRRAVVEMQRPSGTSLVQLVGQVKASLATVDARIDAGVVARSYSKADIDTKVTSPPSISSPGAIVGATGRFDSGLFSIDARNFIVVTQYAASWIDLNGHFGISPSSRRFKQDIETWSPGLALLFSKLRAVRFRYNITDQPIGLDAHGNPILGPHPDPGLGPLQYGFIAEELVDAGLEQFTFKDADGQVMGINYDRLVVPLFAAAQSQQAQIESQQGQIDDLTRRLERLEGEANA